MAPVSSPWANGDIGNVGLPGSADESNGVFTIDASGKGIRGSADQFHYVYQPLSGDGSITAYVSSLTIKGKESRAGLMIRESLADDAPHVMVAVLKDKTRTYERATPGGGTAKVSSDNGSAPRWLRLERSGNMVTTYRSSDGSNWTTLATRTVSLGQDVYIGLAVTSGKNDKLSTGVFTDVTVVGGGAATATPTATNTPVPPTATPTATNTPVPPTATPTATNTSVPPTATNTPIPPTATPTATNTPVPPTATPTATATPPPDVVIQRATYMLGGQVIAVRVTGDPDPANNGRFYLHSDHLGSVSAMSDENGAL
ncbi:MAG: hypothetical protein ACE5FZ_09925, partial [Nitrospiria bacterium]